MSYSTRATLPKLLYPSYSTRATLPEQLYPSYSTRATLPEPLYLSHSTQATRLSHAPKPTCHTPGGRQHTRVTRTRLGHAPAPIFLGPICASASSWRRNS